MASTSSSLARAFHRLRPYEPWLVAVLVASLLALAVHRVLFLMHDHELALLADVIVKQVEDGQAARRRFANRILGPYAIYYASRLGLSVVAAMKLAYLTWLVAAHVLAYALFRRLTQSHRAALPYLLATAALLVLMQARRVHPWDFVDLVVFTLLLYGIVSRRATLFFVLLFLVAILNRETALFIPAWLLVDGLCWHEGRLRAAKKRQLATAAMLAVVGVVYTAAARELLFTTSYLEGLGLVMPRHRFDGLIHLPYNLQRMVLSPLEPAVLEMLLFFVLVGGFLARARRRIDGEVGRVLVVGGGVLAATLVFQKVDNARGYIPLIPFLLYAYCRLTRKALEATAPGSRGSGEPGRVVVASTSAVPTAGPDAE